MSDDMSDDDDFEPLPEDKGGESSDDFVPDDVDDEVVSSDADFGGAVINAVTAVLGVAVAISTVCNLAGYGFMQTDEGLYFGTIQQTRMRYQLDHEVAR